MKNHIVTWNHEFQCEVTMVIGKDEYLQPCELILQLKQEVNGTKNIEDLGEVVIDLAEYANMPTTTRKYLLQEAKINSAIRVESILVALCVMFISARHWDRNVTIN